MYEMGTIVFSSFDFLSHHLLPVYFSHYMFVQYLAQWDPVLVRDLRELCNTKVRLMRERINLTGGKKKEFLSFFVGIPIMTSSEWLNPRWLIEQGKHAASFSQLASKHVVFFVRTAAAAHFPKITSPLLSEKGKEKDTLFSVIWHFQFLALSFSSFGGYLTFC